MGRGGPDHEAAPMIDVGLTWADKYGHKMSETNKYGIAMCKFCLGTGHSISWLFIVVDPTLCLSWIDGHWAEERAHSARESIMRLVRLP